MLVFAVLENRFQLMTCIVRSPITTSFNNSSYMLSCLSREATKTNKQIRTRGKDNVKGAVAIFLATSQTLAVPRDTLLICLISRVVGDL